MTELHPWIKDLTTAEADALAKDCAHKAMKLAGKTADRLDELESQAYLILVECSHKVEDDTYDACQQCGKGLSGRRNAKFCGPTCRKAYNRAHPDDAPPAPRASHIGCMWSWSPERMKSSAVETVGFVLANAMRGVSDDALVAARSSASMDILSERIQSRLRMGADPLDIVLEHMEGRDVLWHAFGQHEPLQARLDGTEHRLLWATEAYANQGVDLPPLGLVGCPYKTDNNGRRI